MSDSTQTNANAASKFYQHFQQQKQQIQELFANNQSPSTLVKQLDIDLQQAFIYLPAYDQNHLSKDLESLKEALQNSSKKKKGGFKFKGATTAKAKIPTKELEGKVDTPVIATSTTLIADKQKEQIVLKDPIPTGDCELRDLTGCVIDLRHSSIAIRAFNCHRISHSTIIGGSLAPNGSLTLRDCQHCVVVMGMSQFRIEGSSHVNSYIYCTSHPVIERSTGIGFGQYPVDQMEELPEELTRNPNRYEEVDDFNWLKRNQKSPNWKLLPEVNDFCSLINS